MVQKYQALIFLSMANFFTPSLSMSISINVRRVHTRAYWWSVIEGNLGMAVLSFFKATNAECCKLRQSLHVRGALGITWRTVHQPRMTFINFFTDDSASLLDSAKRQDGSEPFSKAKPRNYPSQGALNDAAPFGVQKAGRQCVSSC